MDVTKLKPPIIVHHIEVAEGIGRISIDGEVGGKLAACVFMIEEIPKSVKTDEQLYTFYQRKLKESVGGES